jgi:hypothetical protein
VAAEQVIDTIEYGGVTYVFVDSTARENILSAIERMNKLNERQTNALQDEIRRATGKEDALEESKVTKVEGKDLSTNDFTDAYKDMLDNPAIMQGATASKDGASGLVPKPLKGQQGLYLDGGGNYTKPHDTTYDVVTQTANGLMIAADKKKLDSLEDEPNDQAACTTTFVDNVITETFGNGRTVQTTFNSDGSITQVITKADVDTITLHTVFNSDGSITRTKTITPVNS